MKLFLNLFCIGLFFISCRSNESNQTLQTTTNPVTTEIPSDFLSFYDLFHTDPDFQINHVIYPLKSSVDSVQYHRENWTLHKAFDSQGGNFYRQFNNINGIIIEIIKEKNGFVTIERRFSKIGEDYQLIYYDIESTFDK